jgi:excisionase family DNA binding protein
MRILLRIQKCGLLISFNKERGKQMSPNNIPISKLAYSIREAVTATSLSKTTLYAKIAAKELRAVRVGGRTVIPTEELVKLLGGEA